MLHIVELYVGIIKSLWRIRLLVKNNNNKKKTLLNVRETVKLKVSSNSFSSQLFPDSSCGHWLSKVKLLLPFLLIIATRSVTSTQYKLLQCLKLKEKTGRSFKQQWVLMKNWQKLHTVSCVLSFPDVVKFMFYIKSLITKRSRRPWCVFRLLLVPSHR